MRGSLLGIPIDLLGFEETLNVIERLITAGGVHQHVALNAAKIVAAQKDLGLRRAIEGCEVISADGMSLVWAGRLLGVPLPERVAGIDLMAALLERAARLGWPVYFLGATQHVVERAVSVETQRNPGLKIAGYRNGYWCPTDESTVVEVIARSKPRLLFVAMPSPKKEQFLAEHKHLFDDCFVMGVGGSFDVIAGATTRAPKWMQQSGLEWVHRLRLEPRRLARRYAVGNTKFILGVLRALLRGRSNKP